MNEYNNRSRTNATQNKNSILRLPYSFVPCSDLIYIPSWAYMVSHDIPFEESYSGAIDVTLENAGYLCVGGGSNKSKDRDKNESSNVEWERDESGRLVIPGTTIKGMLRSVAQIICFGKFNQFNHKHHSFREFITDSDFMRKYHSYSKGIHSAWIKREDNGEYTVRYCSCAKAFDDDVNKYLLNNNEKFAIHNSIENGGKNQSRTAGGSENNPFAKDKYENISKANNSKNPFHKEYQATIKPIIRKTITGITTQAHFQGSLKYEDKESKKGYLVFSNYRVENEKNEKFVKYSYFYYDVKKPNKVKLSEDVYRKFVDSQSSEQTISLIRYLENPEHQHPEYGMPVWIFEENGEIKEVGISRVPRLICTKSIDEVVRQKNHNFDFIFDLGELMFGTIRNGNNNNFSLKSRLGFSDFITECKPNNDSLIRKKIVLQGPKTSFYSGYLVNYSNFDEIASYSHQNATVAGWKRYKVQSKFANTNSDATDAQCSIVEFLTKPNTKFKGTILFHNLKKEELGALLFIINFWSEDGCYHMLGHAKPYGAGAVQLKAKLRLPSYCKDSISAEDAIEAFKNEMNAFCDIKKREPWEQSNSILNLKSISKMHNDYGTKNDLVYNVLDDFKEIRKEKEHFVYPEKPKVAITKVDDNIPLDSFFKNYSEQYKSILEEDHVTNQKENFESIKLIHSKIDKEKEKLQSEMLKAQRNEHENKIFDLYTKLNSIKLVSDNPFQPTDKEVYFEMITYTSEHISDINDKSILRHIIDLANKELPDKSTVHDYVTKVPKKKKDDAAYKAKIKNIREAFQNIKSML